jgi:hypothetical protein
MTEHSVTIGIWLRAYDSFSIEADTEAEALEKAKAGAKTAIESAASPEHIDIEVRREGIILFIDRITPNGRVTVMEDIAFDDDRFHDVRAV